MGLFWSNSPVVLQAGDSFSRTGVRALFKQKRLCLLSDRKQARRAQREHRRCDWRGVHGVRWKLKPKLEPTPKIPLSLWERVWGEGKRTSESIEKTGSDSGQPHLRPFSRRTGEGRLWDKLISSWYEKKEPPAEIRRGLLCISPGSTYSRTFGTTIGPGSLTAVFGMGTGVSFQVWPPGRTDAVW